MIEKEAVLAEGGLSSAARTEKKRKKKEKKNESRSTGDHLEYDVGKGSDKSNTRRISGNEHIKNTMENEAVGAKGSLSSATRTENKRKKKEKKNELKSRRADHESDAGKVSDKSNTRSSDAEHIQNMIEGDHRRRWEENDTEDPIASGKKAETSSTLHVGDCTKKKKRRMEKKEAEGTDMKDGNPSSSSLKKNCLTHPKKESKSVSFSRDVDMFSTSGETSREKDSNVDGLIKGKRFTKEEDVMVKDAVLKYIELNNLGEEGLHKVLNCSDFPEIKGCWKDIGASLPWRPWVSVYYRAHILFERSEKRGWTSEEFDYLRRHYKQHGADWKKAAGVLGKHRFHVKDAWRRIKLPNARKGNWSQEEYQNLFDLVNLDLRLKAFEEKKTKHGMLRDNISWEAISEKLATRQQFVCCLKWYKQLTSKLVIDNLWADTDDYLLISALQDLDAFCIEDVNWDSLLEHRSGDICQRRWQEMARYIGGHKERSFMEQVDVLSKRYCPEMLEYRKND